MHVQYSLIETTRIHDLSIRKMHLIREDGRTAVPTNRSIRSIRDSLLRPVSIRLLHVAHFYAKRPEYTIRRFEKCISLDKIVVQLSPRIDRSVRFVTRSYDPSPFEYCACYSAIMSLLCGNDPNTQSLDSKNASH